MTKANLCKPTDKINIIPFLSPHHPYIDVGYVTTNVRYVTLVEDSIDNAQTQITRDTELCMLMVRLSIFKTESTKRTHNMVVGGNSFMTLTDSFPYASFHRLVQTCPVQCSPLVHGKLIEPICATP